MGTLVDRIITAVLSVIAVVMLVVFLRREFRTPPPRDQAAPSYVSGWHEFLSSGLRVGRPNARVTIVEFMDFECPYCRRADSVLMAIQHRFGPDVAVVYMQFPLPNHRFAVPAARAAECAHAQNRFDEMRKALYARQDSFGLKPWGAYALDAGVPDSLRFLSCVQQTTPIERIVEGRVGERIGVRGTPTILLNGWRFAQPPSYVELEQAIEQLLAGKDLGRSRRSGARTTNVQLQGRFTHAVVRALSCRGAKWRTHSDSELTLA